MSQSPIYLDYAAATPLDGRVLAAMQPYLQDQFYNPSATYQAARTVHTALEAARAGIAYWFGSRPSEVVFTAGGTEANNLATPRRHAPVSNRQRRGQRHRTQRRARTGSSVCLP